MATSSGIQEFVLRPVTVGSYYRFQISAYNRAGAGAFSKTSHPPIQIPNRNQYIAMKAEEKKKADHEELMASLEGVEDEDDDA